MKTLSAGGSYYGEFCTTDATGALADATGTPAVTVTVNGVDDDWSLTAAKLATGRYKITGDAVPDYDAGDLVQVSVTATVATIATGGVVDEFVVGLRPGMDAVPATVDLASLLPGVILTEFESNPVTAPAFLPFVGFVSGYPAFGDGNWTLEWDGAKYRLQCPASQYYGSSQ